MANLSDFPKYNGSQLTDCIKQTPLTRLDGALAHLRSSEKLVASVADRLVGDRAEIDGSSACAPSNPGIFGEIEDIADTIARLANDIERSATRIGDRL